MKQTKLTTRSGRIPLHGKPLIPEPEETEESRQILEVVHTTGVGEMRLQLRGRNGSFKTLALPGGLGGLILEMLNEISKGNAVRLLPIRPELTTHEAAELLNVSRTHLIGLLEKGQIPYRLVGTHRRVALTKLLAYKEKTAARRKQALSAIAAEAQELKLYE